MKFEEQIVALTKSKQYIGCHNKRKKEPIMAYQASNEEKAIKIINLEGLEAQVKDRMEAGALRV